MRTSKVTAGMALLSTAVILAACGTNPAPSHGGNTTTGASGTKHTTGGNANKAALGGGIKKTAGSNNPGGTTATAKNGSNTSNASTTKAAGTPIALTTLPAITAVEPFNPAYKSYHAVSSFVNEMGFHWMTQAPGIVYMTNNHNQITGVEATFPQNHGNYPWYDPATPPSILNASLAFYSEHLYFVPPTSITPGMSAATTSDLTSWTSFVTVNTRLQAYVKEPSTYKGYTIYGPPHGLGIKVLVSPAGLVSGFMVGEPAAWGWSPVYAEPQGQPVVSRNFGKAYLSVFMVEPATASSASAAGTASNTSSNNISSNTTTKGGNTTGTKGGGTTRTKGGGTTRTKGGSKS